MMQGKTAVIGLATTLWVAVASPTWGESGQETVTWGAEQCREAAVFAVTDYANVAPLVPAPFEDNVLKAGAPGDEMSTLILTLNRCTNTTVVSKRGAFATAAASEVILGVMLSGSEYSGELVQFYTLANYIDWEPLATAFNAMGLPTAHVPRLSLSFSVNPLTHLGTIALDIPAPAEHITAAGTMVALSPPPLDARAASLGVGPRGVVVVDHHSPLFSVNPGATATITTDRPDGVVAKATGTTSRQFDGVFFEKGPGHNHSARLMG